MKQSGSKLLETYGSSSKLFSLPSGTALFYIIAIHLEILICSVISFCSQAAFQNGKLARWGKLSSLFPRVGMKFMMETEGTLQHSLQKCAIEDVFRDERESGSKILVNHKSLFCYFFVMQLRHFSDTFIRFISNFIIKIYFTTSQIRDFNLHRG